MIPNQLLCDIQADTKDMREIKSLREIYEDPLLVNLRRSSTGESTKNIEIGRVKAEKKQYMKDNMSIKKDKEEEEVYENAKKEYDRKINFLRKEIESLDESERDEMLELEVFIDLLNKTQELYTKASYVRKRKICKILFSNIKITHEKRLLIQPKAGLETLFTHHWWSL